MAAWRMNWDTKVKCQEKEKHILKIFFLYVMVLASLVFEAIVETHM
jgi:hypothetical protein